MFATSWTVPPCQAASGPEIDAEVQSTLAEFFALDRGIVRGVRHRGGAVAARPQGGDRGRTLDVALTEFVLSMMEGMLPEYSAFDTIRQPTGSRIPTAAPSNAYPSADGKWMLIAANSEPIFARLANLMGRAGTGP